MLGISKEVKQRFKIYIGVAELRNADQMNEGVKGKLKDLVSEVEEESRRKYVLDELKDVKQIRQQRNFFWMMDVDPTRNRPAAEALLRRVLAGRSLPRILPIVDAYNAASIHALLTFSAFDTHEVNGNLHVRFSSEDEVVILIGNRRKRLMGKELVLTDDEKILCVYAYGDVNLAKIVPTTRDVLLVAYGYPGASAVEIKRGLELTSSYILDICGGEVVWSEVFQ
jgi:DNA/RNA-binding domain of Phe-tRNA-synthetase-like protein